MTEKKFDPIRETDAESIRLASTLIRTARFGALAVLDPKTGAPSASRVATATDLDGTPLILVSALSGHTAGLMADPRCSLLLGEPGKGDPLAHPRITIACRAEKLDRNAPEGTRARRRYLNRHPKAKLYADFGDFSFFRLAPQGASLNGGFARAYVLARADFVADHAANAALADTEQGAIDHMNADHRDAVAAYARHFAGVKDRRAWLLTGVDAEGLDIASGEESRRIFFASPLADAADLRGVLVDMAKTARNDDASTTS